MMLFINTIQEDISNRMRLTIYTYRIEILKKVHSYLVLPAFLESGPVVEKRP